MTGRVVLITGGAGHIGLTAAETYLELGADVVLADMDGFKLNSCADRLEEEFGRRPTTVACDLESEASWRESLSEMTDRRDQLDVLVNCAAFVGTSGLTGWATSIEEQSLDTWRRAVEVNLTAPFGLVQALLPQLRRGPGGGVVINVSSVYGLVGTDLRLYEGLEMGNPAGYAATKGGLLQLTRYLATVLAPEVRVNAIAPGGIARAQPPVFVERYGTRTPLGRLGVETDLKGAFAYLGSDLSSYVTAHTLVVDGGWTAW